MWFLMVFSLGTNICYGTSVECEERGGFEFANNANIRNFNNIDVIITYNWLEINGSQLNNNCQIQSMNRIVDVTIFGDSPKNLTLANISLTAAKDNLGVITVIADSSIVLKSKVQKVLIQPGINITTSQGCCIEEIRCSYSLPLPEVSTYITSYSPNEIKRIIIDCTSEYHSSVPSTPIIIRSSVSYLKKMELLKNSMNVSNETYSIRAREECLNNVYIVRLHYSLPTNYVWALVGCICVFVVAVVLSIIGYACLCRLSTNSDQSTLSPFLENN